MDTDARPEKHIEGVMPKLHLTVGVRADTDRTDLDFVAVFYRHIRGNAIWFSPQQYFRVR